LRKFILALSLLLIVQSQGKAAPQKIVKDSLLSQGKSRTFYLFVPETVKPADKAPLLVLLHGTDRNGLSIVEKWKDLASTEGLILVGPDALTGKWSTTTDSPAFLHDLVESLRAKYPIDSRRIYLFGHSGGATFALYMSLLESEYFAGTAIHAGALLKEDSAFIAYAKRKIPIAMWVGTKDQFFPLGAVRATRDMLNGAGFAVELTEIKDHDHDYYGIASKLNPSCWTFLKKQVLENEPQYRSYSSN
jgi:poly(3-hydroxybutyrate) depolymerase